jgi:peptide/nickel transport system permease protein
MATYLLKRFFILLLTLILVSIVIFAVLLVIPSDPAQIILGIHATPETLQTLRHQLGLDRPFVLRYLSYLKNLTMGELGRSITYDIPIRSLILSRLQVTIPLTILSMIFAIVLSIPLGIYSSLHRNRVGDYGIMVFHRWVQKRFLGWYPSILLFMVSLTGSRQEGSSLGRWIRLKH